MRIKKLIILLISILCILAIGITTILIVYNSGDNKEKIIVKGVVTDYLTKYKNLDGSCLQYLAMNITGSDMEFKGMQELFAKQLEFKIKSVKKTEDYYTVKTEIENVDYGNVMYKLKNEYADSTTITGEKLTALIMSELAKSDVAKRNFSCDIIVSRYGNEYRIQMTPDLSNAILGGFNEFLENEIEERLQQ